MTHNSKFVVFSGLYLVSFAVLAGWFVMMFVGFVNQDARILANKIAVPTLLGSVVCLAIFKRLARLSARRAS